MVRYKRHFRVFVLSFQGDSGGALVRDAFDVTPVQYGIVSWGADCGDPDQPSMFTRVAFYVDWIHQTMRKYGHAMSEATTSGEPEEEFVLV